MSRGPKQLAHFDFSGTLGDAFIALCKISDFAARNGCTLCRLERPSGVDTLIGELASFFPGVEYRNTDFGLDTIQQMRTFAFTKSPGYLNIFWDGKGRGNEPDDPAGLTYTEHPSFEAIGVIPTRRGPEIGIQIHSGSRPGAARVLDPSWVVEVCELLTHAGLCTVILGTGAALEEHELALLQNNLPPDCENLLGRTDFPTWLNRLRNLDYLITIDGFSAYFALSQDVHTLMLFEEREALLRLSPSWRLNSFCTLPDRIAVVGAGTVWQPFASRSVAAALAARFNPDGFASTA